MAGGKLKDEAIEAAARAAYERARGKIIERINSGRVSASMSGIEYYPEWGKARAVTREPYLADAEAAINAYLAARKEAGFVEVPVEPTQPMIDAAEGMRPYREEGGRDEDYDANTEMTWNGMIAARPQNEGE